MLFPSSPSLILVIWTTLSLFVFFFSFVIYLSFSPGEVDNLLWYFVFMYNTIQHEYSSHSSSKQFRHIPGYIHYNKDKDNNNAALARLAQEEEQREREMGEVSARSRTAAGGEEKDDDEEEEQREKNGWRNTLQDSHRKENQCRRTRNQKGKQQTSKSNPLILLLLLFCSLRHILISLPTSESHFGQFVIALSSSATDSSPSADFSSLGCSFSSSIYLFLLVMLFLLLLDSFSLKSKQQRAVTSWTVEREISIWQLRCGMNVASEFLLASWVDTVSHCYCSDFLLLSILFWKTKHNVSSVVPFPLIFSVQSDFKKKTLVVVVLSYVRFRWQASLCLVFLSPSRFVSTAQFLIKNPEKKEWARHQQRSQHQQSVAINVTWWQSQREEEKEEENAIRRRWRSARLTTRSSAIHWFYALRAGGGSLPVFRNVTYSSKRVGPGKKEEKERIGE